MNINVRKIFDWNIVDVSQPVPVYSVMPMGNRKLVGYTVALTYRHHGTTSKFFDADSERLWMLYPDGPLGAAREYYEQVLQRMMLQSLKEKTL